jgi:hypothetical protein
MRPWESVPAPGPSRRRRCSWGGVGVAATSCSVRSECIVAREHVRPSAFLDEVVAEYPTAALEADNPEVFLAAVGHVARARGRSAIAERAGLGRESL